MCDSYLLNRVEFSQGLESPSSRLSDVATRFLSGPPLTCCFCCQERRSLAAQIQLKQTKAPLLWGFNLDSIKETKELGEKIEITWTTSCTFSPAGPSMDARSQTGPLSASSNPDFSWSIQCSLKFKQKIVSGHFYSHTPGATLSLTMWVHRSFVVRSRRSDQIIVVRGVDEENPKVANAGKHLWTPMPVTLTDRK